VETHLKVMPTGEYVVPGKDRYCSRGKLVVKQRMQRRLAGNRETSSKQPTNNGERIDFSSNWRKEGKTASERAG